MNYRKTGKSLKVNQQKQEYVWMNPKKLSLFLFFTIVITLFYVFSDLRVERRYAFLHENRKTCSVSLHRCLFS